MFLIYFLITSVRIIHNPLTTQTSAINKIINYMLLFLLFHFNIFYLKIQAIFVYHYAQVIPIVIISYLFYITDSTNLK